VHSADRCDRCGAQAYTEWREVKGGRTLLFCAHHADEHSPALADRFDLVRDDRADLVPA